MVLIIGDKEVVSAPGAWVAQHWETCWDITGLNERPSPYTCRTKTCWCEGRYLSATLQRTVHLQPSFQIPLPRSCRKKEWISWHPLRGMWQAENVHFRTGLLVLAAPDSFHISYLLAWERGLKSSKFKRYLMQLPVGCSEIYRSCFPLWVGHCGAGLKASVDIIWI